MVKSAGLLNTRSLTAVGSSLAQVICEMPSTATDGRWFSPGTPVSPTFDLQSARYNLERLKEPSKPNAKKTSSPKGNDRSPESNVPRSICPKTLCSLSPTPMMLLIKFDQDWPTGFRDIQVQKCEIFVTQKQVTPK